MKPKRQKHWKSEEQIIKAIDASKAKAAKFSMEAEAKELNIKDWHKRNDPYLGESIACLRFEVDRLNKKVDNLLNKRCKRLQAALAAMRTVPMSIMGEDTSVVY
jgi:hypothetical protein